MRYWILKEGKCVYVMHGTGTGYYKIGRTINIRNRLEAIRTASPAGIELIALHYVDDYEALEGVLHKKFHHVRRGNSEWFKLSEDNIAFLSMETTELVRKVLVPRRVPIWFGMIKRAAYGRFRKAGE